MQTGEMTNIFNGRSVAYNVLSRVFIDSPDETSDKFFAETMNLMFEIAGSSANENIKKGAEMLGEFLEDESLVEQKLAETRDLRTREYTKLFILGTISIPIYESIYTSPQHLVKQDSWEKVKAFYNKNFFKRAQEDRTMEDHIAMELQFVGLMSSKTAGYIENHNFDDAEESITAQFEFLTKHLANWAFLFCDKVASAESKLTTPFYPGYALMLKGFLEDDIAFLQELAE